MLFIGWCKVKGWYKTIRCGWQIASDRVTSCLVYWTPAVWEPAWGCLLQQFAVPTHHRWCLRASLYRKFLLSAQSFTVHSMMPSAIKLSHHHVLEVQSFWESQGASQNYLFTYHDNYWYMLWQEFILLVSTVHIKSLYNEKKKIHILSWFSEADFQRCFSFLFFPSHPETSGNLSILLFSCSRKQIYIFVETKQFSFQPNIGSLIHPYHNLQY